MRRRPLLRAAAVGGGAYVMGKHKAQGQQREAGEEGVEGQPAAAAAPAPAAGGMSADVMQRLQQLGELHDQGVLTDDEFAQQKAKLLG
jgi:hypothetical protein